MNTQRDHHAAIGGVALVWTQLENHLQQFLWRLADLDWRVGRCITQHMPFRSLCDAMLTVARETDRYKPVAAELEALLKECDALRVKRNDIVHALWAIFLGDNAPKHVGPDEVTGMVIKARGHLNLTINKMTIKDIESVREEILAFHKKIADWAQDNLPEKTTGQ